MVLRSREYIGEGQYDKTSSKVTVQHPLYCCIGLCLMGLGKSIPFMLLLVLILTYINTADILPTNCLVLNDTR